MRKLPTRTLILLIIGLICLLVLIGVGFGIQQSQTTPAKSQSAKITTQKTKAPTKLTTKKKKTPALKINWQSASEKKAYPDPQKYTDFWIDVSLTKQRVYLMNGKTILYTMYASTGSKESPTPAGTFYIEPEHGESFYNANSGEGAKYWRSFLDHGIYLFHSVPTDQAGNFIPSEAEELGKTSNSHGCIRLSVADAEWFYTNIPVNTKVVIH